MAAPVVLALGGSLLRPEESERHAWLSALANLISQCETPVGIVVGGGAPAREAIELAKLWLQLSLPNYRILFLFFILFRAKKNSWLQHQELFFMFNLGLLSFRQHPIHRWAYLRCILLIIIAMLLNILFIPFLYLDCIITQ